jgi:hypothetical protein
LSIATSPRQLLPRTPMNDTFTVLPTYLSNCTLALFHEFPTLPDLVHTVLPSTVTFNWPILLPYIW